MAYWSSNSSDAEVEQIEDTNSDEGSSMEAFEVEFTPIDTTNQLLKKMRERWWVFFGTPTVTTTSTHESTSKNNPTFSGGIFGPIFSGHRFILGGDKTTH